MSITVASVMLSRFMARPTLDVSSISQQAIAPCRYLDFGIRTVSGGNSQFGSIMIPYNKRDCQVGFSEGEFMSLCDYLSTANIVGGVKVQLNEAVNFHEVRNYGYGFASCDFFAAQDFIRDFSDFCVASTVSGLIAMPRIVFDTSANADAFDEVRNRDSVIAQICRVLDDSGLKDQPIVLGTSIFHREGMDRNRIIEQTYMLSYPFLRKNGVKIFLPSQNGINEVSRCRSFYQYVNSMNWDDPQRPRVSLCAEPSPRAMTLMATNIPIATTALEDYSRLLTF